jgi:hypothetical protein
MNPLITQLGMPVFAFHSFCFQWEGLYLMPKIEAQTELLSLTMSTMADPDKSLFHLTNFPLFRFYTGGGSASIFRQKE